jgi:hypothetical protein
MRMFSVRPVRLPVGRGSDGLLVPARSGTPQLRRAYTSDSTRQVPDAAKAASPARPSTHNIPSSFPFAPVVANTAASSILVRCTQRQRRTKRALRPEDPFRSRYFSSTGPPESIGRTLDENEMNDVVTYLLRPEAEAFHDAMLITDVDLTRPEDLTSPCPQLREDVYREELRHLPVSVRMSMPPCLGNALYHGPERKFVRPLRSSAEMDELKDMGPIYVLLRGSKSGDNVF